MIEKWLRSVDRGGQADLLLTDLSRAFDGIDHELSTAKFQAYGFDKNSLYFYNLYLKGQKQRNNFSQLKGVFLHLTT